MSSEKVICFTDSRGNPLFSLPDSSFLCLEYGNGDSSCAFCRYHSEEQVEIDGKCRNIRQFAKQMEKNGIRGNRGRSQNAWQDITQWKKTLQKSGC